MLSQEMQFRDYGGLQILLLNPEKEESLKIFESEDPYKYTKILTSSSQLIQDILDRKWGSNLIFRICFLEAFTRIKNKKEISKTKLSYKLSIIFRACLIPDIILLAERTSCINKLYRRGV